MIDTNGLSTDDSRSDRDDSQASPSLEITMKLLMARVYLLATLTFSLIFPVALPAAAERPSDGGPLLLWLLGLNMAREQEAPRKIDINTATVEELAAVPGLERRQAQRITDNRPYAELQDLTHAGLSPRLIEQLAALLTVGPEAPTSSDLLRSNSRSRRPDRS